MARFVAMQPGRRRRVLSSEGVILLDAKIARQAARVAFKKLDPRSLIRNPVMFVVEVVAVLVTLCSCGI